MEQLKSLVRLEPEPNQCDIKEPEPAVESIELVLDEININPETGETTISRRGLCRLLGISQSNLSISEINLKLSTSLSNVGYPQEGRGKMPLKDTEVATIIHHYATSPNVSQETRDIANKYLLAFSTIGLRKYFQQIKGWDSDKQESPNGWSQWEALCNYSEFQQKMKKYVSDKPGLELVIVDVCENKVKSLSGMMTLPEFLGSDWDRLDKNQRNILGRMAADTFKSTYLRKPEKEYRKSQTEAGEPSSHLLTVYPSDFEPQVRACYYEVTSR